MNVPSRNIAAIICEYCEDRNRASFDVRSYAERKRTCSYPAPSIKDSNIILLSFRFYMAEIVVD